MSGEWHVGTLMLKHLGIWLFVLGTLVTILLVVLPAQSTIRVQWRRYVAWLESECRRLYLPTTGAAIARSQLLVGAGGGMGLLIPELTKPGGLIIVLTTLSAWALPLFLALLVGGAPYMYFLHASRERLKAIEGQVDGWLQLLANSLSAVPALGQAIDSTRPLTQPPLTQELDVVVKEVQLGTPLERALLSLSERVGSRPFSSALSAILIGRRTGGELTKILERSAESFREMHRLEGVVRTKTAESRIQIGVIGVLPIFAVFGLEAIREGHFDPMLESATGGLVAGGAVVMWLLALLWARKIMMVRI